MFSISRETHCALAGIDVEAFKTLRRLERVPQLPTHFKPTEGFGLMESLSLAIARVFVEQTHVSATQAASIASSVEVLLPYWTKIQSTSKAIQEGHAPDAEILFGVVRFPSPKGHAATCGTLKEIADAHADAISIDVISISRIAALFRQRAQRLYIDLTEFWNSPLPAARSTSAKSITKKPSSQPSARKKR